ncbi:MAG: FAD:protein FMN transferase [Chloroflexi bacterium]|nr:FAD:protein FMN transferase [Chloroflexota bacterium]
MQETRILMGMPITVELVDDFPPDRLREAINTVFAYFEYVDEKFSTYKECSEISLINNGALTIEAASKDMQLVFALSEQTKQATNGYFDITHNGRYDPSGLVKGWAIYHAAAILRQKDFANFYVEAGGDIQVAGKNAFGQDWRVGIRNPFNLHEIVKVLAVSNGGVATSGTYIRGQHIYNPNNLGQLMTEVVSLTVIGADIYEADRFATAAFAMGRAGITFIEQLEGFEGYQIDQQGQAIFTSGFARYVSDAKTH